MDIEKGYAMLWLFGPNHDAQKAVDYFTEKYGRAPTQYRIHPEDHPLVTIGNTRFRKSSRLPIPMKGQMYLR